MKFKAWKKKFLKGIKSLPKKERGSALCYYEELFLDKKESGYTEKEILEEFGLPKEAAFNILYYSDIAKDDIKIKKPNKDEYKNLNNSNKNTQNIFNNQNNNFQNNQGFNNFNPNAANINNQQGFNPYPPNMNGIPNGNFNSGNSCFTPNNNMNYNQNMNGGFNTGANNNGFIPNNGNSNNYQYNPNFNSNNNNTQNNGTQKCDEDIDYKNYKSKRIYREKSISVLKIVLTVLFFIVFGSAITGIAIGLWSTIFALIISGFAITLSGFVSIVIVINAIATGGLWLAYLGICLILIGSGILLTMLSFKTASLCADFTKWFIKALGRFLRPMEVLK